MKTSRAIFAQRGSFVARHAARHASTEARVSMGCWSKLGWSAVLSAKLHFPIVEVNAGKEQRLRQARIVV
jgi:hypothetical protein